ncbi:amino acid dehydrogenase [Sulfurifustis variabilis]|uniref:D-amino acid dehydrogenase n=2 Tax=Sulfurifustis variabilis TaxID=1675686 RepID=A0A1B4V1J8_9GAMM|nr:D-amino acid dehydrogenase [Sulfurifustis variabilis]BAU47356.1 amino acid dehydrogenase [Sulfurifustis variabilis]
MNVVIVGGGVIGVTSAWFLRQAGHDVTVIDRQSGPALETSFANAGQVSWTFAKPWAAPGVPRNALKWMLQEHAPLVLRPRLDLAMWSWLLRMLANCREPRYLRNLERMLRIARYSHETLVELREQTGIVYDHATRGTLQLFRDEAGVAAAERERPILERLQVPHRVLDAAGCLSVEPGLRFSTVKFAGGVHYPDDETGDCHAYTSELARRAEAQGVVFRTVTAVRTLEAEGDRVRAVHTDGGQITGEVYVLAAGSYTPLLARPLGIRLPVYPVKGYSATVPIENADAAPGSTLTDERYKVAITRLGNRLRAAGTAELAGYDLTLRPARLRALAHVIGELFPRAGDLSRAEYWTGLRPMTPDNLPVIGPTPYRNLYLNTGHGTLGWTMSNGSARLLADIISGKKTAIDLDGLTLARFGRG